MRYIGASNLAAWQLMKALGIIGTAAMLWVGGGILAWALLIDLLGFFPVRGEGPAGGD